MTPVVLNLAPTYQASAEISPVQEFTLTLQPTRAAGLSILASEEIVLSLQLSRALSLQMPHQESIAVEFAEAIRGERGFKGDLGNQGIQGLKGEIGFTGPVGSQGIQGIQGDRGQTGPSGGITYVYQAAAPISGHRMVTLDDATHVIYASSGTQAHANRVLGMSVNAAAIGDPVTVQKFGELTEPSWNWQLDKPVYLDIDGGLTQITPDLPGDKFSLVLGFPISSTSLFINVGLPIVLT